MSHSFSGRDVTYLCAGCLNPQRARHIDGDESSSGTLFRFSLGVPFVAETVLRDSTAAHVWLNVPHWYYQRGGKQGVAPLRMFSLDTQF